MNNLPFPREAIIPRFVVLGVRTIALRNHRC